jgi:hypothetical protein
MTLDVRNGTNVTVVDMDIQTRSNHSANNWKSDPANTDKQDWRLAHLTCLGCGIGSDGRRNQDRVFRINFRRRDRLDAPPSGKAAQLIRPQTLRDSVRTMIELAQPIRSAAAELLSPPPP